MPQPVEDTFQDYTNAMRKSLEGLVHMQVGEESWSLATFGIRDDGLGLRDASMHAPAAYLASERASRQLASSITKLPEEQIAN